MTSDDEWTTAPVVGSSTTNPSSSTPRRLFNLKLVNSYGNANIESLLGEVGGDPAATIQLAAKNYIALDWHPRARTLFYNDKAAEEMSQDEASFHPDKVSAANAAANAKKQTIGLTECLKLFTSQVFVLYGIKVHESPI
jgi:ubiquitin carboxyl-terminal hydrolase 4/11/15